MLCVAAPPSDQDEKVYVEPPIVCGDVALIEFVDPITACFVSGVAPAISSMPTFAPVGCVERPARDAVERLDDVRVAVRRSEAVVQDHRPAEPRGGLGAVLRVGRAPGEVDRVADLPGERRGGGGDRRHRRVVFPPCWGWGAGGPRPPSFGGRGG